MSVSTMLSLKPQNKLPPTYDYDGIVKFMLLNQRTCVKAGPHTQITMRNSNDPKLYVKFYAKEIAVMQRTAVTLSTGGNFTYTTTDRFNRVAELYGYLVELGTDRDSYLVYPFNTESEELKVFSSRITLSRVA